MAEEHRKIPVSKPLKSVIPLPIAQIFPIDRLYASHIIHVDEGIVNISIHYECYFSIELGMGRQGAGKTRIKEVIRHE